LEVWAHDYSLVSGSLCLDGSVTDFSSSGWTEAAGTGLVLTGIIYKGPLRPHALSDKVNSNMVAAKIVFDLDIDKIIDS